MLNAGIQASMGGSGDAQYSASALSVMDLFKTEVVRHAGTWKWIGDAEFATLGWVHWFNNERLPEPPDFLPPAEYDG
jgi:hypothetical protein